MRRSLAAALACVLAAPGLARATNLGVLLLAPEGGTEWRRSVEKIANDLGRKTPARVAFGIADARQMDRLLGELERARAKKILAVPLYWNPTSPEIQRLRYVLGLRETPADRDLKEIEDSTKNDRRPRTDLRRASTALPLAMTGLIGESPLFDRMLADRLGEAARNPDRTAVLLLAPGADDDAENRRIRAALQGLSERAQELSSVRAVHSATVRLQGDRERRDADLAALKGTIRKLSRNGRVTVLPLEFEDSGLGRSVENGVEGAFFATANLPLGQHPNIVKWVRQEIDDKRDLTNQRWFTKPFRPVSSSRRLSR